ncbi:MAG: PIN domain-containing protein [Nanoarchaeota archaeon]|nr:PIN domain-containing protein [Nanoarchaeota archaeon]
MIGYKLLDSSIWVDYFVNGRFKDIIDSDGKSLLATISLIEIRKKLRKLKIPETEIKDKMSFLKMHSLLVNLDEKVADKASQLVTEKEMLVADSIVYASALLSNAELLTVDNDFRGLQGAQVL